MQQKTDEQIKIFVNSNEYIAACIFIFCFRNDNEP